MIRSLPFSTTLVFPTATASRREAVRAPDLGENPGDDPFNRALARQRDAARMAAKAQAQPQGMSQAPAPVQPPMQAPTPESAAAAEAKEAAAKADVAASAPGAAIRTANRTALRPGEDKDRPAQLDPEPAAGEARHGRKNAGSEAELLARLFKTAPSGLPPKLAPLEPEDPDPAAGTAASENAPGAPGVFQPQPPVIECPVDPNCTLHAAAKAATEANGQDGTQALQDRAAQAVAAGEANAAAPADATALAAAASGVSDAGGEWAASASPAEQGAEQGLSMNSAQGSTPGTVTPGSALTSAPGSGAPAGTAEAPRSATLEARPGSEAFAMKFSAQVAVWVREGVHEAQLQLNPADMGPVRVAIVLDGAAAQVNFTAEHALTRQALEQALPTLAGSLADAGFTLAGGGVFDQPQQAPRNAADDTRRSADSRPAPAGDERTSDAATATAAARPRGMVDLVA